MQSYSTNGATARSIARFRPAVWITAFSPSEATCQVLQFSYGVMPVYVGTEYGDWSEYTRDWLGANEIQTGLVILTQGPSPQHPTANHRIEVLDLGAEPALFE